MPYFLPFPLAYLPLFPSLPFCPLSNSSELFTLLCCSFLILLEVKEWAFQWIQLPLLSTSPAGMFLPCFGPRFTICQISLLDLLPGFQTLYFCHKVNQCVSVEPLTKRFGKSQTLKDYWLALNRSVLITRDHLPNANQREQSLLCKLNAINYSVCMPSGRWQYLLQLVSMPIKYFMDLQPPWCHPLLQAEFNFWRCQWPNTISWLLWWTNNVIIKIDNGNPSYMVSSSSWSNKMKIKASSCVFPSWYL